MAVVVDKDNQVGNVTSADLAKILRGEIRKWPDGRDVVLVFHKASSGERATLVRLMKISESELQPLISTHKNFVRVVDSDADVIDLVGSTPGGVGLVDVRSISSGVNVVKVGGKLPTEGGYLPH
jgi:ABC-type phosphate transport system substrate-binding protein